MCFGLLLRSTWQGAIWQWRFPEALWKTRLLTTDTVPSMLFSDVVLAHSLTLTMPCTDVSVALPFSDSEGCHVAGPARTQQRGSGFLEHRDLIICLLGLSFALLPKISVKRRQADSEE